MKKVRRFGKRMAPPAPQVEVVMWFFYHVAFTVSMPGSPWVIRSMEVGLPGEISNAQQVGFVLSKIGEQLKAVDGNGAAVLGTPDIVIISFQLLRVERSAAATAPLPGPGPVAVPPRAAVEEG